MISFRIDGTPRGKKRVDQDGRRGGHRFTDRSTVKQEDDIGQLCRNAMGPLRPLTGAVKLTISAVFAIPKSWNQVLQEYAARGEIYHTQKPDCDNIAKLVKDALNGVAWHDDSQVAVELIRKRFGGPERVDVTIEEAGVNVTLPPPMTPSEERRVKRQSNERLGLLGRRATPHNAKKHQRPTGPTTE